uniref:EF-hand domain-containing protein n=1 Tax=Sus scrofa TaxID=9823 RepID=A0A4X1UQI1_PIG
MATPDRRVLHRPQGPGRGPGEWAFPGSLDDLPQEETQELAPAELAMLRKAQEFFQTCDAGGKGFIARSDMQRLHKELPLSLEDLEDVFDALDADGNGFLTPGEFTTGFSHFFFSQNKPKKVYQSRGDEDPGDMDEDEEAQFQRLMDRLGAQNVLEDESDVKQLWLQLKKDEPHLLSNFEDFLTRIFLQLQEAHEEKNELECALKKKIAAYDEEIQHLYEEMEQQIKSEKEKFLLKDTERFQARSQELEQKLFLKEQELEQLIQKQKRLEGQCTALHNDKHETKAENTKLKLTNQELAQELERTYSSQMSCLPRREVYRVTESLQREKSGLLKQLDFLRERNKHLRDERDIRLQKDKAAKANTAASTAGWKQRSGSVIGKYVDDRGILRSQSEEEEDVFGISRRRSSLGLSGYPLTEEEPGPGGPLPRALRRIISIEEDPLPQLLRGSSEQPLGKCPEEEEVSDQGVEGPLQQAPPPDSRPRLVIVCLPQEEGSAFTPDRLFKIVFVGNSAVGKTSFLGRFCDGRFSPGSAATVGIDYRVKTVRVDDSKVALQLWDTAGQERYRCITQQFFRKADGVAIMYDLTARQSFLAVRQWLSSVEVSWRPSAISGNLTQTPTFSGNKVVQAPMRPCGRALGPPTCQENNLIFYECSAFSGHNAEESLLHLARILKEQEDTVREETVQVDRLTKKKACCG